MKIDCISDLHGYKPELEGGDLLLVCGDLTAHDEPFQVVEFLLWLDRQKYEKKIFIAGNHDKTIEDVGMPTILPPKVEYLQDSGTEFEGLKIWGSPWTLTFEKINPKCTAFTGKEIHLYRKYQEIPDDIDILMTHGPPYGIFDENKKMERCGSGVLRNVIISDRFPKLKLHAFGHIHAWWGSMMKTPLGTYVNCSYVDDYYNPMGSAMRIIL